MEHLSPNLRKAAVLIRSLDAETAATLLAQLPPADAAAIRAAVEVLGAIDSDEEADVAAEMKRAAPLAGVAAAAGVELSLSTATNRNDIADTAIYGAEIGFGRASTFRSEPSAGPRFEFLEQAPITSLVPYLAREHAQTIAVVLSYLSPSRASAVLAALPSRQQADTLERLNALGETDPDSLKVVEQELASWVASQSSLRRGSRTGGAARAILAAANSATRESMLANLKNHKRHLAAQLGDAPLPTSTNSRGNRAPAQNGPESPRLSTQLDALRATRAAQERLAPQMPRPRPPIAPPAPTRPRFQFDDLVRLDAQVLMGVLQDVDPNVLILALVGSSDELVKHIAGRMPKRTAKAFRRQLRSPGPTRLSDVEAAQRVVAQAASERISRPTPVAV